MRNVKNLLEFLDKNSTAKIELWESCIGDLPLGIIADFPELIEIRDVMLWVIKNRGEKK